jgi:hypothetical protein
VTLRLRPGAVISGRIVDEFGEPVLGAHVTAHTPSLRGNAVMTGATTDTDDRGEYRLGSLAEGSYIVRVMTTADAPHVETGPNGAMFVWPSIVTTYYPGASDVAQAQELPLRAGEEQSGIDFVIPSSRSAGQPFSVMQSMPISPMAPIARGSNQTARPSGMIRGRVISTDGRALPYAQVGMLPNSNLRTPRATHTDDAGAFEFLEVPAGPSRLVASKPGYFLVESSSSRAISESLTTVGIGIDMADGERRLDVEVTLARWATLTGQVRDEDGEPVEGAAVQLMHVRYEGGRRRLVPTDAMSHLTNDLGVYRLYGLAPGVYIVSAVVGEVRSADLPGYARSYYPGTPIPAEAQFVTIGRSRDLSGIDIVLSRMRTFRITGSILDAVGEPTMGGSVTLMPSWRSPSATTVTVGARLLANGSFEFPNVAPGQYVIQVYRDRKTPWTEGEFGAMPVVITDRDVKGLIIRTSAGSSITGRFSFDTLDPSKGPPASAVELTLVPVDPDISPRNVATADIHPDWTFTMLGINGSRRLHLSRTPAGWMLKEILVNGIDVTDRSIPFGAPSQSLSAVEVALSDRVSELTGTITDEDGHATTGATVIVFASDRDRWYAGSRFVRRAQADDSGRFSIAGMPSGSYYVAAVARPPSDGVDAWQDPSFLAALVPRAFSVSIADAERWAVRLPILQR